MEKAHFLPWTHSLQQTTCTEHDEKEAFPFHRPTELANVTVELNWTLTVGKAVFFQGVTGPAILANG